jgi:hypothetical protein
VSLLAEVALVVGAGAATPDGALKTATASAAAKRVVVRFIIFGFGLVTVSRL